MWQLLAARYIGKTGSNKPNARPKPQLAEFRRLAVTSSDDGMLFEWESWQSDDGMLLFRNSWQSMHMPQSQALAVGHAHMGSESVKSVRWHTSHDQRWNGAGKYSLTGLQHTLHETLP